MNKSREGLVHDGGEQDTMSKKTDKCEQLRKLHDRLVEEVRILEEGVFEEEEEGVANPVETVNVIKSLKKSLEAVHLELQKCPGTV
jgi:hypothetical protein